MWQKFGKILRYRVYAHVLSCMYVRMYIRRHMCVCVCVFTTATSDKTYFY